MTRRCDSNPAQYERNRRFGHLVHALGRAADGAKLPSVGLCLNASKAVSCLVKWGNDTCRSLVSRKAQNNVTLLGGRLSGRPSHGPRLSHEVNMERRRDLTACRSWPLAIDHGFYQIRCRDSESSVDDLGTWRGVVLGRAVTTLRSVETQPYAWGFVLSARRDPEYNNIHAISREKKKVL